MFFKKNKKFFNFFILFNIFLSTCYCQECPEIFVPPYAETPRECTTTLGSTCLITCPDEFEITGSCFRTCIPGDSNDQPADYSEPKPQKSNKKRYRPLLFSLKPKRVNLFLPATPINKFIKSGKQASCCNKPLNDENLKNEFTRVTSFNKREKLLNNHMVYETCPGRNLPEHHLLNKISNLLMKYEQEISSRQDNMPKWSGTQPYCVNTEVTCPEITDPPRNGYFIYCFNYAGLSCAFGCNSGYRLIGSSSLLCESSGSWSDEPPRCASI